MDLAEAQNIMRGYMAPRSHAINYFTQHGSLMISVMQGAGDAKQELIEAIWNEIHEQRKQALYHANMANNGPVDLAELSRGYAVEFRNNVIELQAVGMFIDEYFSD